MISAYFPPALDTLGELLLHAGEGAALVPGFIGIVARLQAHAGERLRAAGELIDGVEESIGILRLHDHSCL